jgi:hypothetical protein
MVLSIVSLGVAFAAVAVNASGIVRRPRVVARWGEVHAEPRFREGLTIIVTARR